MSYQLLPLADFGSGIGSSEESGITDTVLDYTFISDENFLLLVLLTELSSPHLVTYHKTASSSITEIKSLAEIYSEWVEPVVISLTQDAAVVVLLLSNSEILLLPIHCLINTTWGKTNALVSKPLKFSVENVSENEDQLCFRLPTSAFCFNSSSTNRSYLVYSNKAGTISIVDLQLKRLVSQVAAAESIHHVNLYQEDKSKFIVITQFTGAQALLPLEVGDFSVRETLSHIVPSELSSRHLLNTGLKFFNQNAGFICAINQNTSNIEIYKSIAHPNQLPVSVHKMPSNTWMVHYSSKLMTNAETNSFVQVVCENSSKVIGIVPIVNCSSELEECILVMSTGLFILKSQKNIISVVADYLSNSYFAVDSFNQIANNLRHDPTDFCLSMLRAVLKSSNQSTYVLDGLISLAFEVNVEIQKLMDLLNEFSQADLLLPFLSLKCEKDPANVTLRQFLFNAYMTKLWKLNNNCSENAREKEALEYEIRHFLIKFESSDEVLQIILKQSLWSCVAVLLSKDPIRHSVQVARSLIEMCSWKTVPNLDGLIKCISFLQWSSLDSTLAHALVSKMTNLIAVFTSISHLRVFMDAADSMLKRSFDFALPLFVITSIKALEIIPQTQNSEETEIRPKLSCGSNCTAAVADQGQLLFWGDFSAGALRLKNEETRKRRRGPDSPTAGHPAKVSPNARSKRTTLNKPTNCQVLIPKLVNLPPELSTDYQSQIVSVSCGTEHVLALTEDGFVLTWGRNRYGQCGNGTKSEIVKPMVLKGDWGKAVSVHAGHYHSGLHNDRDEIWLWGWGMYGQLGNGNNQDVLEPMRISDLCYRNIVSISLGYAHSLFLKFNGKVFGCGAFCNGQLGVDPLDYGRQDQLKSFNVQEVPLHEPARLIASGYFHGIAVSAKSNAVYEFGECPQTLKMKTFLMKRLRTNSLKENKSENQLQKANLDDSEVSEISSNTPAQTVIELPKDLPRDHMKIRKLCVWDASRIDCISAGFNHSALITTAGELYTWGKNLEMQLGHGTKKDRTQPSPVIEPRGVIWSYVQCARNSTTAVTKDGRVYAWGRNDKNQLGLGILKKPNSAVRRIIFKATKGPKSVELPDDNHVTAPTVIPGLQVLTHKALARPELENQIAVHLENADQVALTTISRYLARHPSAVFSAVEVHLLAGDIIHALDVLVAICQRTELLMLNEPQNEASVQSSGSNISDVPSQSHSKSPPPSQLHIDEDQHNGNPPSSKNAPSTSQVDTAMAVFDSLLDRAWALLRCHPIREIQTMALVVMLFHHFPIYNRLSADQRLCRLIESFLEPGPVNLAEFGRSISSNRRITEMGIKERYSYLKSAKVPGSTSQKYVQLRQKCDRMLSADQLRFFAQCGHYEKCVVESGPAKLEFASCRNRLKKCTRCITKSRMVTCQRVDRSSV
ncbi:regulator of chromosome condensation (RCC1) repeat domain-containing protein [Ditylenchus destructor]|nr:regulator of chromosome condensation (RCC1) repeat domain-containing protein [Ditylenchus destructor]